MWIFLLSSVLLVVGLISPRFISKLFRRHITRKGILKVFGALLVASFVGIAITAPPVEKTASDLVVEGQKNNTFTGQKVVESDLDFAVNAGDKQQEKNDLSLSDISVGKQIISTNTVVTSSTGLEVQKTEIETTKTENAEELYLVKKVVDGDTFDVSINGQIKRIRLIGVDTPETVDPRKAVQCFGKEASNKAVELLFNKKVKLEADSTQGELDKYGRLLRYVIREDGLFFNKWMIENGYAHEYTYSKPYKYQQEFKNAQQEAETQKRGLWADNACPSAPVEAPKSVTPTSVAPVTSAPTPAPTQACTIKGNISSDGRKLYHLTNCPSYKATKIEESQGEKWFCSEPEAVQAGWTKAGNC